MTDNYYKVSEDYHNVLAEEYKRSAPAWVTADWIHELKHENKNVHDDKGVVYCFGFDDNEANLPCDVCKSAEKSALYARNLARDAVEMSRHGDWETAAHLVEQIKDQEVAYGGCVVWGNFYLTAIEARDSLLKLNATEQG